MKLLRGVFKWSACAVCLSLIGAPENAHAQEKI